MIKEIIKGIATVLHNAFPTVEIYTENVPQGFSLPCFFIRILRVSQKPQLGNRFSQEYFFDIHYFPESENKANEEMNEVALRLYDLLEHIAYDSWRFSGRNMYHEQQEEALHFFISFFGWGYREKERLANMEHLTIEERVKKYGGNK